MRGANTAAIAVRDPEGQIVIHEQALNKTLYRGRIAKTPFVRGIVGLWDALVLGTRSLMWSADVAVGEEDVNFNGPIGWATIAISFTIGIGIFFLLPAGGATAAGNFLGLSETGVEGVNLGSFAINFIEGLIRLGLLIGYIWLIGRMNDVKRLFGYHGAEHKTINAYEAGAELTPEVVSQYPIEHPRCGTAFLLTVVLVSILVFSVLGRPPGIWLFISRIILIPVIAGISYEILKWSAANLDKAWVRTLVRPNLMLQHLTTNEPDLHMIEVAIVSFKRVLLSEGMISDDEAQIPAANPEAAYAIGGD